MIDSLKGGRGDQSQSKAALLFHRDVAHISTCDDGCLALAELLGWKVSGVSVECQAQTEQTVEH